MIVREYCGFIKNYLEIAHIKTSYVVINVLSAFLYGGFWVCLPLAAAAIVQNLTDGKAEASYYSLLAFVILYALYGISLFVNYKIYGFVISYCYDQMTREILKKLLSVDVNFNQKIDKGLLLNSLTSDIFNIADMSDEISELLTGIAQVITSVVIASCANIVLGVILGIFTIFYIGLKNIADRKINYYHNKVLTQEDRYTTLLTQTLSGLQEIKTFNMLPKLRKKLSKIQFIFTKNYTKKRHYYVVRDLNVKLIMFAFRFVLYMAILVMMINGRADIGLLILAISYHESLITNLDDLIDTTATIRETNSSVMRVKKILNYNTETINFGELEMDNIHGVIEFENVTLELNQKKVLDNINLKIPHDKVVAIVGESGAGKTMMFNLLLRLYQPTKGKITLDGENIYDFSKKVYTNNVSIVSQKPFIFDMSIRKNLDFVDKNISHQIEACKKAGIHNFIETLPNGYNTILREGGGNVSGGQKQMISIARTILTGAEVLLLDDITTSLDPDTAKLVPKLVKNLKDDHTIVIITKKPELMREADEIVVLKEGKINDIGTHKQLLERNEIYQMLQSRKSPSKVGVFDNIVMGEAKVDDINKQDTLKQKVESEARNV